MSSRFACAAALLLFACKHSQPAGNASQGTPAPAGIAAYTRHGRFVDAKISPKGTYLAAISTEGGKRSLSFVDLKTRKLASAFRPDPESVGNFYWANDSRVVVELWNEGDGSLAAPVNYGELYAVDASGGRGEMIFGYRAGVRHPGPIGSTPGYEYAWGHVVGRLRNDDRRVLIEAAAYEDVGDRTSTLYKLDVYNGRKTQVTIGPVPGAGFITDENGEPRIALGSSEQVKPRFFYRDTGESWSELAHLQGITKESRPLEFESAARTLELSEPLEKGFGVFALNIGSGERKLLSRNDWTPPGQILENRQQQVLAVEYEPDLPVWDFVVPDHPLSKALKGLLAAYPDENVRILNATDDEKAAVALVYGDRDPGRFLLLDVQKMAAEELVSVRPWVKPEEGAEMTAFHIPARDGVWIHGYVTLPRTRGPGSPPPPLVVLPHGGPHFVRDRWGYDPEVQLLASQGFAVLQVNYRGSGGYGLKYQQYGYGHWGDRIIEDVIDATRYAVRKGYGDARRICIYGASFGAFAALQSAIEAPELFRCAIGYAGVYDLTLMAKLGDISETRLGRGFVRTAVGTDEGALKRQSPAYNAGKLKAKVLLIHGKKDPRAPFEHAERMRKALEEAGSAPAWLVEPKEGHGFYDEDARERMYARLIAFLQENTK